VPVFLGRYMSQLVPNLMLYSKSDGRVYLHAKNKPTLKAPCELFSFGSEWHDTDHRDHANRQIFESAVMVVCVVLSSAWAEVWQQASRGLSPKFGKCR
jgi:hypothetical protein